MKGSSVSMEQVREVKVADTSMMAEAHSETCASGACKAQLHESILL